MPDPRELPDNALTDIFKYLQDGDYDDVNDREEEKEETEFTDEENADDK